MVGGLAVAPSIVACLATSAAAVLPAAALEAPTATRLSIGNGGHPFAGDHRLLTTITPNGDGFRDRAIVRFVLSKSAWIRFEIRSTRPDRAVVYAVTERRPAGSNMFVWAPGSRIAPRTYIVTISLHDQLGRVRRYGPLRPIDRPTTPVVRVVGVEAGFRRASSAPGSAADLWLATDAKSVALQFFRVVRRGQPAADELRGDPVSEPRVIKWTRWRDAPRWLRVWIGSWPSGVYFLKATADDGRVGYAPIVVRPRELGEHRVALVMPTNTWQAYNFRDGDGNGFGDTWYAAWGLRTIRVDRPYDHRGVPRHFRDYDLPFLAWLQANDEAVDVLAEQDLEAAPGASLARLYDAIWFSGHEEYVTKREYEAVVRFRNRGGNLAFLAANNFYWKVVRGRSTLTRVERWRNLGRPEAALVGVQYLANDRGQRQGPYIVRATASAPWFFEGTGLVDGASFGRFGIEIDRIGPSSPPQIQILAEVPDVFGPGKSAQMTYYETAAGAKVFAAGAFTLGGRALGKPESLLLANLWRQLAVP
jgi:hypothetical protein